MSSDEFDITTNTEPGAILDRVLRKTNLLDLTDCYLGAQVDYSLGSVAVFFAEEATREQLESLETAVEDDSLSVQLEQVDNKPIAWVLRLEKVAGEGETQAVATGDVSVDVPLSGKVDVVNNLSPGARDQAVGVEQ